MRDDRLSVLKFGGSVLTDTQSVRAAAAEVARYTNDGWRVVAVVSALHGETDRLVQRADAIGACESSKALLVSTGELVSAALLGLALRSEKIAAQVLDSAAAGIGTEGSPLDATPVSLDVSAIKIAMCDVNAIVLPGFVGRDGQGRVTLLGRGGSDFTALFVAHQLGARCRLFKDVDGLYDRDPNVIDTDTPPRRYETIHWDDALELDSEIVQPKAVRWSRDRRLQFEIGSITQAGGTRVGAYESRFAKPRKEIARPITSLAARQ